VDDLQLHCGVVSFQCVRVELEHDQTLSGKTAGEEGMSSLTVTAEWAEHLIAAVSDSLYQPEGIRQGWLRGGFVVEWALGRHRIGGHELRRRGSSRLAADAVKNQIPSRAPQTPRVLILLVLDRGVRRQIWGSAGGAS
jgi:hypothetical protein